MKESDKFTIDEIKELKKRKIDFSDIPELTAEDFDQMYPRNWKPKKQAVSVRIDLDTIEWLKEPGDKGYLKRLNAVLRWAKVKGCPINSL